jgi:beta-galactosidase GanA
MEQAHINVVRIGEFAWSTIEPSEATTTLPGLTPPSHWLPGITSLLLWEPPPMRRQPGSP